jgi:hypothetical protein
MTPAEKRARHRDYMREWRKRKRERGTEQKYDELARIIARMMPASTLDPARGFFLKFLQ